jgi:cyclomaltodextrin glucanotransferase
MSNRIEIPARKRVARRLAAVLASALTAGCSPSPAPPAAAVPEYYGTAEPFASEAIYFVVTDRFVNGDPSNDHRDQGGTHPSFDIPLAGPGGEVDNIGYLGGDFKGIVEHADYIRDMGFSSVWVTPIVENPDEAFTGGDAPSWGSILTDRGKSAYHGYWGTNFYRLDEHWPSAGLDFAAFTGAMRGHGLKVVLDIVCNHGSPAWSMPVKQPQFGQVFAADGTLLADHQNLPPEKLDPQHEPLHRFFHTEHDLAQLADFDDTNPAVLEYLSGAYLQWIAQGAAAFRIDTVSHMPPAFWKQFAERVRTKHPDFFMFGEAFDYDAAKIAPYTQAESGALSVLDFPLKAKLAEVFGKAHGDFAQLESALFLDGGPYRNAYELMTFYDNHDMARLDANDEGFIDAHNWLFTARGIPIVYYGSEIGFMRGRAEHQGNRNYFGVAGIETARGHPIREHLARIAKVRAASPALQRGLQIDVELRGDRAAFYRVYQRSDQHQIALVLLNKGEAVADFDVASLLESGTWTPALGGDPVVAAEGGSLKSTVAAHDVQVYLLDSPVRRADLSARLAHAMRP